MIGYHFCKPFFIVAAVSFSFVMQAQDTTRKRTVQVTSQFKPVLKDAAKINLNASPPTADTSRPRLQYQIPNQNLQFVYQLDLFSSSITWFSFVCASVFNCAFKLFSTTLWNVAFALK